MAGFVQPNHYVVNSLRPTRRQENMKRVVSRRGWKVGKEEERSERAKSRKVWTYL